jgi:type I restriction enzyme, R subunit
LLTPANLTSGKEPRYYQRIAIDRAVQAILQGRKRVLLTMATGTGKTVVAFQICWKLWFSKWNAKGDPTRKPRILYFHLIPFSKLFMPTEGGSQSQPQGGGE